MTPVSIGEAELDSEFHSLVDGLLDNYEPSCGIGGMTTNIYDTAWVACVQAPNQSQLIPEALDVILEAQDDGGAWAKNEDLTSRILSSLAGLHTLLRCRKLWQFHNLDDRISDAQHQVGIWLQNLDDSQEGGVAFEMIVPCLLNLLAEEKIFFDFLARDKLLERRQLKLAKIRREVLYETSSPLLHSLEAFFDDPLFDFDRFTKHKVMGSMMASPASTAAYLMRSSRWDDEAEAYLRRALKYGAGRGSGTFPSAFPSTIFEITWVLSTTLSAGFDFQTVSDAGRRNFENIFIESGAARGECIAFAPGLEADLDDTAKMSITASLIGFPQITNSMVAKFETESHMETYKLESNASFSANCNALMALLVAPPVTLKVYRSTIEKVTRYLCDTWAVAASLPVDKWNVSPYYATMLMAESFAKLVERNQQRDESLIPTELLREQVLRTLVQYVTRTMQAQKPDGSWATRGPHEETAYAVIGLTAICRVAYLSPLLVDIQQSIQRGRRFLEQIDLRQVPEHLWVEKVLYGSQFLRTAYVLSALRVSIAAHVNQPEPKVHPSSSNAEDKMKSRLFRQLPMLQSCPAWVLTASALEAETYIPPLMLVQKQIFPREGHTDDKYFRWIPMIWTVANNFMGSRMTSVFMADMMAISVVNFQADEYIESMAASESGIQQNELRFHVTREARMEAKNGSDYRSEKLDGFHEADYINNGSTAAISNVLSPPSLETPIRGFFDYIHDKVQGASSHDRRKLFSEIVRFFDAHLEQNVDNEFLAQQKLPENGDAAQNGFSTTRKQTRKEFQSWVRGTAADHTSCPYSFAYVACISARDGKDFFPTSQEKYIAEDLCRHLATMCRLYNDAGSLQRDRDELNLNCANFASVQADLPEFKDDLDLTDALRHRILGFTSYERAMLDTAREELSKVSSPGVMDIVQVFIQVTDMFGEIYLLRDLANRKEQKMER